MTPREERERSDRLCARGRELQDRLKGPEMQKAMDTAARERDTRWNERQRALGSVEWRMARAEENARHMAAVLETRRQQHGSSE